MAIAATMSQDQDKDEHEHDMVMPGFRFHPTEEELVEFYLRRKVEGKRFNVELITFLDLYRYDPWELPALAAIGEKEWFFYVPRDRKYRNGDRPNRVTTSGYWKATGADRMIRSENFRSIGLKKTLVFYSGKAPKGIRTSWIMNEYRLPQHETEKYQKAEISLCRVYKRAGVEDHSSSLPRSLPSRPSSSRAEKKQQDYQTFGGQSSNELENTGKMNETRQGSGTNNGTASIVISKKNSYTAPLSIPSCTPHFIVSSTSSSSTSSSSSMATDDLHRLVNYQHASLTQQQQQQQQQFQTVHFHPSQFPTLPLQSQPLALNTLLGAIPANFSWEWNPVADDNKDYHGHFPSRNQ